MNIRMYRLRYPALWLAIAWSLVVAVVYLSLAPMPIELPAQAADKYAHLAAYAALMLWFIQIYDSARARVVIALGLVALGVGLEFAQDYTGYRSFEYADMAADAAGVVLGWLIGPPRTPNMLLELERLRVKRPGR